MRGHGRSRRESDVTHTPKLAALTRRQYARAREMQHPRPSERDICGPGGARAWRRRRTSSRCLAAAALRSAAARRRASRAARAASAHCKASAIGPRGGGGAAAPPAATESLAAGHTRREAALSDAGGGARRAAASAETVATELPCSRSSGRGVCSAKAADRRSSAAGGGRAAGVFRPVLGRSGLSSYRDSISERMGLTASAGALLRAAAGTELGV